MTDVASKPAVTREPPQILNNRIVTLIAVLLATGLLSSAAVNNYVQKWFVPAEPVTTYDFSTGATTELDLTVVSADARRLTCASDKDFDGLHCALYADKRKAWPLPSSMLDDNLEHTIQPYRTASNNTLVLVAGLWAQPQIATRIHDEPTDVVPVKHQARFTARCKARVLGKLDEVWLRWEAGQQWYKEGTNTPVPVAQVESCTIDKQAGKDDKPTSTPDDKPGDNGTH